MYTLRRSAEFEEQAESIEPDVKRFDEVIRGIEYAIAKAPYQFPCVLIGETEIRVAKTRAFPGVPPFRVFFALGPQPTDPISLLWIEELEGPEETL